MEELEVKQEWQVGTLGRVIEAYSRTHFLKWLGWWMEESTFEPEILLLTFSTNIVSLLYKLHNIP